jgi:hypothetical protein
MIYKFTFPIDSYYGDQVFFKDVYFEGSKCPTHEEVVNRLQKLAYDEKRMSEDERIAGPHCFEVKQCLDVIQFLEDDKLPYLYGRLVMTNGFCHHPKWGRQPVSVTLIRPEQFETPFVSWYDKKETA